MRQPVSCWSWEVCQDSVGFIVITHVCTITGDKFTSYHIFYISILFTSYCRPISFPQMACYDWDGSMHFSIIYQLPYIFYFHIIHQLPYIFSFHIFLRWPAMIYQLLLIFFHVACYDLPVTAYLLLFLYYLPVTAYLLFLYYLPVTVYLSPCGLLWFQLPYMFSPGGLLWFSSYCISFLRWPAMIY